MTFNKQYNVPAPRYTSYPTVPYWTGPPDQEQWKQHIRDMFHLSNTPCGISLYIHLPFCESLCTYCACNTRITVNHSVEAPYLETLLREWELYLQLFDEKPRIRELHLGGGTPTFFSAGNLQKLISGILSGAELFERADLSFEGHPANTSRAHLQVLYDLGFRRVSFGIQDFDSHVQELINRYQSLEEVQEVVRAAREIGYTSVNFDLVYGLPGQSRKSMRDTIDRVLRLRPDRIAFYSYAHVPWLKPGQRKFTEQDLPKDADKRQLYIMGKKAFGKAGYKEVGMDHFSLGSDMLYKASIRQTLHRNFMGYTAQYTRLLIGLGASAISDSFNTFVQNEKRVEAYYEKVGQGIFPFSHGHVLSAEDRFARRLIHDLMCRFRADWTREENALFEPLLADAREELKQYPDFVKLSDQAVCITTPGKAYVRNICMAFDARLRANRPQKQVFSTTA